MSELEARITNAGNVKCHLVGDHLTLFVNLSQRVSKAVIASVSKGTIFLGSSNEVELPYTVVMMLINYGATVKLEKAVTTLQNYTKSHYLVENAQSPEESPYWTLDGSEMLGITVRTASFPDRVMMAQRGESVQLVKVRTRITTLFGIELNITCPGKAEFPRTYLQSVSNPRFSDSLSRPDEDTEFGYRPSSASPPAVARQLSLAPRTPEVGRSTRHQSRFSPAMYGAGFRSATDREIERQDDILTVDASDRKRVRVLFYPRNYSSNVFNRHFPVLGDIGVQLGIEVADADDPRVAPRQERARTSSSSFQLQSVRRRLNEQKEKPINVEVELIEDPRLVEPCLTITFNSEETHGTLNVDRLVAQGVQGMSDGSPSGYGSEGAGQGESYLVASCTGLVVANYIIDFSAMRTATQIPTEREVYVAVNAFFAHNGFVVNEEGSAAYGDEEEGYYDATPQYFSFDMLQSLDLEEIREYVFGLYDYFVSRATLEERQTFSLLIWSSARECVLNKVLQREEPLLDQMDNIIAGMLQA